MEQKSNKALVKNNTELLSEMESLLILGGLSGQDKDKDNNAFLSNCDNNVYCGEANCGN